jgi:transcriptional regulator GlxA family with amidase domain
MTDDQRIVMAGGGTTWLDVALFLIACLVGIEAAMQVASPGLPNTMIRNHLWPQWSNAVVSLTEPSSDVSPRQRA